LDLTDHACIWAWIAPNESTLDPDTAIKIKISTGETLRTLTHSVGNPAGNWPNTGSFFAMSTPTDSGTCSGGGQINVVADPTDGQPFTGRSLSPRSWLTYDYDDADRGFALDTLNHPDTYYGGQKLGNLISLGTVERALSGRDSPYKMGNGQAEVDDSSRLLSTLEATAGSEFWFNREITINLAPAASVALAQTPHTRFRGIVTGYPTVGLQRSIAFTSVLGSEFSPLDLDRMIPSRQIKDDFPDAPTDSLDKYVPIGMGIFPDRGTVGVPVTTGVENVVATLQTGPAAVTGFTATFGAGAPGGSFGDYRDLGEGLLLFYEVRQRVGGVWSEPAQASVTTGSGGGHVDLAWTPNGSATAIQIAVSGRSDFLQFSCLTTELSGATTTATDITGGIKEGFNTLDIWTLGLRINEFYTVFAALDDGSFSLGGGSNQLIIAPAFPDRLYNADVTWDAYVPPTGRTVTGYRIIRHRSYYSDWGPVYDWQGEVGAAVLTVADVGHGTAYYDSYVDNPLVQFPGGASSQDAVVIAIPAGKEVIGGTTYNRLVLFGHAIRDIDGIYKSRDIQGAAMTSTVPIYDAVAAADFGSTWLAPGYSGWPFANDYVPYGTDNNWYTVIFTTIDPLPTSILVRCCAMEDIGDATGSTIDGAARQFFHLFENFILPPAGEVWTSGAWLAPRTFDDGTPVINSLAIDALEAIEVARIGRYYRGQIYLDQPITIRTLLGRFFDSFGIRFGENHHGQLIGVHLDDFADLSSLTVLTDVREIVDDTRMDPRLTEMANTERYDYGYRPAESKQFLRINQSQADSIAIGSNITSTAIAFVGVGSGLSRSGAFINPATSWTRTGWFQITTSFVDFKTLFLYGDVAYIAPYVWLGTDHTGAVTLETYDGTTYTDQASSILALGSWNSWAAVYDSGTHQLSFYVNNALVSTITVNFSTFVFSSTTEFAGNEGVSQFNDAIAHFRTWQLAKALADLQQEWQSPTVVSATSLLAATPLTSPSDLADTSGNGRNWSAIGAAATTVTGPFRPTGNRGRVKSHSRQMYFVDDPYTADDVIARDLAFYKYPPRYVSITCGLQAVPVTLGSIVAVTDFQGIGADGWTERPLWVLGIQDVYNDLNTPPTITLNCVDVLRVLSGFGLWADGSVPNWASSTEAEQANNMYWADASDLMSDGAPAKVWG
jgi:hypothetical protein